LRAYKRLSYLERRVCRESPGALLWGRQATRSVSGGDMSKPKEEDQRDLVQDASLEDLEPTAEQAEAVGGGGTTLSSIQKGLHDTNSTDIGKI